MTTARAVRRKRLLLWLVPAVAVVVGLVVLLALGGSRLMEYRRNCAAAERVAGLGGWCDWEERKLPWPFTLLGDEWGSVRVGLRSIGLNDTPAGDDDLAQFADLTGLEWLSLSDTQITDAGLAHLAGLTTLVQLYLDDTRITDAGLVHIAKLSSLQLLDIEGTQVTDAGLVPVGKLNKLIYLWLSNTRITDAGVAALREALPALFVER